MKKLNDQHLLGFIKLIFFLFLSPILGGFLGTYVAQSNHDDYRRLLSILGSCESVVLINIIFCFVYLIIATPSSFIMAFLLKCFFNFDSTGTEKTIISIFLGSLFFIISFLIFAFLLVSFLGTSDPETEIFSKMIGRSLIFTVPSVLSVKYLYKKSYVNNKPVHEYQESTSIDPFQ
ncbi:unnamed protein product [Commensalibacter communis]|nr:unnamed protein product [Commensalibacter communis]CAI3935323.1 unnamed protein product [Commensalibacter communis]